MPNTNPVLWNCNLRGVKARLMERLKESQLSFETNVTQTPTGFSVDVSAFLYESIGVSAYKDNHEKPNQHLREKHEALAKQMAIEHQYDILYKALLQEFFDVLCQDLPEHIEPFQNFDLDDLE